MGQDDALADLQQPPGVLRRALQSIRSASPAPLQNKPLETVIERCAESSQSCRQGGVMPFAKRDRDHKLAVHADVNLAGQRDIAVSRRTEFPVHCEVIHQVLPAVAASYIATTGAAESAISRHDERKAVLRSQQDTFARQI